MDHSDYLKYAALYRYFMLLGYGKSYYLEVKEFEKLVAIERSENHVSMPVGAAIVPIKYALAKALMKLSQSDKVNLHQSDLTKLAGLSKRATNSYDLTLVLRQASLLLFGD